MRQGRKSAKRVRWVRLAAGALSAALLAAGIAWQAAAAASGGVLNVRFGGDQQDTRVVMEVDRATSARLVSAGDDRRLVLKFEKLGLAGGMDGQGRGLIGAWRFDGGKLTLDLVRDAEVKRRFLLPPGEGVGVYRYVIDVAASGRGVAAPDEDPMGAAIHASLQGRAASAADPIALKKVIVIDAGHGGKDPGAAGAYSREKDINLAAAKALKARLERGGRYKVVMTRDRDVYVPLETRVQIARNAGADLFISLHSDAADSPDARGASVYTLSERGSDRAAKSVFAGGSFIDVDLPGRDRSVKQILLDLTQRATKNQSGAFAELLLARIEDQTTLLRRSHRDAGFVVLLAPDVPAVLLEMGFISNRTDETALRDPARRRRLMNKVGDAIDAYFDRSLRYASR